MVDKFPWAGLIDNQAFNPLLFVDIPYGDRHVIGFNPPAPGSWIDNAGTVNAAGNSQSTATLLPYQINSVVAGSGGVILNPAVGPQLVFARAGVTLNVYPPVGAQIESQSVNVPVTLADGTFALLFPTSTTQWWST